ncbi:Spherulation-specific family 4-domain-containing protein [Xylariales sp. AK1849]|nr:Spherulation-specific family 4-domain-containing protein [Xylariales sp. AK1849]
MKFFIPFAAFAAAVLARVNVMLPFYVHPVHTADWDAVISSINAHKNLHFYLVINPANGPTNPADPFFHFEHGYNEDWTTNVARLNALDNAQTIGYVSTSYNNGTRTKEAIIADIDNWSQWKMEKAWDGTSVNISMHGIWFDETSVAEKDYDFYQSLTAHARDAFGAATAPPYTAVLNTGVRPPNSTYERDLFGLADVVVTRETCWQRPSSSNAGPCPLPYEHYNASTLVETHGLPSNVDLYPKASVVVHYVRPDPPVDGPILADQIKQTVDFGIHSLYFTSAELWETTVLEPATVSAVAQAVDAAQPLRR